MKQAQREVQWSEHIEGWKESGLTQRRYCERESISYDTFKRWRRRLGPNRVLRGAAPRLVPVRVAAQSLSRTMPARPTTKLGRASSGQGVEIRLANGRAIALGAQLDVAQLGRLVRLLELLPC